MKLALILCLLAIGTHAAEAAPQSCRIALNGDYVTLFVGDLPFAWFYRGTAITDDRLKLAEMAKSLKEAGICQF